MKLILVVLAAPVTSAAAAPTCADIPAKVADIKACAESGAASSQFALYQLYSQGSELPRNYKLALAWALKSADQGYYDALNALGFIYYNGWGTTPDKIRAYMWWSLSLARLNSPATRSRVEMLEEDLSREQIDRAQAMAADWNERHARKK